MTEQTEDPDDLTLEHRILIQVRQVLASVVRDVTPLPGMRSPLSESTVEDIRACFALIAARERELNEERGTKRNLPVYADAASTTQVVELKTEVSDNKKED
jgi:hypothetical protein